jgi:Ubiquitin-conjugating enzyme
MFFLHSELLFLSSYSFLLFLLFSSSPSLLPSSSSSSSKRKQLPPEYPFKPPHIMFLTPSGRFETHTKICLSFTAFHPELWQPAWGIRLLLEALISFLPTPADGAIGALDWTSAERKRLARESLNFVCPRCCNVDASHGPKRTTVADLLTEKTGKLLSSSSKSSSPGFAKQIAELQRLQRQSEGAAGDAKSEAVDAANDKTSSSISSTVVENTVEGGGGDDDRVDAEGTTKKKVDDEDQDGPTGQKEVETRDAGRSTGTTASGEDENHVVTRRDRNDGDDDHEAAAEEKDASRKKDVSLPNRSDGMLGEGLEGVEANTTTNTDDDAAAKKTTTMAAVTVTTAASTAPILANIESGENARRRLEHPQEPFPDGRAADALAAAGANHDVGDDGNSNGIHHGDHDDDDNNNANFSWMLDPLLNAMMLLLTMICYLLLQKYVELRRELDDLQGLDHHPHYETTTTSSFAGGGGGGFGGDVVAADHVLDGAGGGIGGGELGQEL